MPRRPRRRRPGYAPPPGWPPPGKYASNQTADDSAEQRWAIQATHDFHLSEQRLRRRLWQLGTDAPGGIPLPSLPPQPHQTWWQAELFPSTYGPQQWLDKNGVPQLGNPGRFDPDHPLYGYDEDGHIVPAYMADPMAEHMVQDGIPIRPLLSLLRIDAGDVADLDDTAGLITKVAKASRGYRPSHINPHIREYYNLHGKGLPYVGEDQRPPLPNWARESFARLIGTATTKSNRVFLFKTGNDWTTAILYNEQETRNCSW